MKLREFLNYRKNCPICNDPLTVAFHSERRQKIRYEDERMLILFPLEKIKKHHQNYKVGYSLGLDDNSLGVEFYTMDEERYCNNSPMFLITRFKELDQNLGVYKIYKHCHSCNGYTYASDYITLNYKKCSFGELTIHTEFFIVTKPASNGIKVFKILNYYASKETFLNYGIVTVKHQYSPFSTRPIKGTDELDLDNNIHTSLIPFTSHDEVANRLDKLILFS